MPVSHWHKLYSADVAAPPAVLFTLLADMPNYGRWLPGWNYFRAKISCTRRGLVAVAAAFARAPIAAAAEGDFPVCAGTWTRRVDGCVADRTRVHPTPLIWRLLRLRLSRIVRPSGSPELTPSARRPDRYGEEQ
jgi:hypothetical protein